MSKKTMDEALDDIEQLRKDAERYRWLRARLLAADFDWNGSGKVAILFELPKRSPVYASCDMTIDAAMPKVPNLTEEA